MSVDTIARGLAAAGSDSKVDKDQGVENAGKVLCVGTDGKITLKTISELMAENNEV